MNQHLTLKRCLIVGLVALGFCTASPFQAQTFGGGGMNMGGTTRTGGGGGGTRTGGGGGGAGQLSISAPGAIGDAIISIDPVTRSLVVIADPQTRDYIQNVVSNMDKPKPQVLINVVFLEVTHNNSFDFGVDVGAEKSLGNSTTAAGTQAWGISDLGSVVQTNLLNRYGLPTSSFGSTGAGVYSIMGGQYAATLRMLQQNGKAKVLSRPSIIALNNQPATITVGQNVPLISGTRVDNYGNVINTVSYTSIGIILQVTPFITSDGMVEMIVSPEISDLVADRSQWVSISSGSAGSAASPIINTRSADTVVITPDGQTVIIGGLMQDVKANSETGIPFLSSIPLLGNLFKHRQDSDQKTELLIFLTPHIIKTPLEIQSLTQHQRKTSNAVRDTTDAKLDRYLDAQPPSAAPLGPRAVLQSTTPRETRAN